MPTQQTACFLSHRGVVRVGGEDRVAFLQGLISNDINLCQPKQPLYAALLTPQGKFLHELFIHNTGDAFLIDSEGDRSEDLRQRLNTYKLRAKMTLENVSGDYEVWAFPEGSDIAPPDLRLPALGSRGIFGKGQMIAGHSIIDAVAYDKHRLALGVTDGSRDMVIGTSTLSDGNYDLLNGISWTKGCYIGQELTARMHHRALVKKRMFPVKISGTAPIAGTVLTYNHQAIGTMRSSCGDIGLALLNIDAVKQVIAAKATISGDGADLTPYQPGWLNI